MSRPRPAEQKIQLLIFFYNKIRFIVSYPYDYDSKRRTLLTCAFLLFYYFLMLITLQLTLTMMHRHEPSETFGLLITSSVTLETGALLHRKSIGSMCVNKLDTMGFYFLSHQSCDVTWQNALICQIDIIDSFEQDWQCDHFLKENLLKFALKCTKIYYIPLLNVWITTTKLYATAMQTWFWQPLNSLR